MEPSFYALNSIFSNFEFGIYLINTVCALIFSYCLIKFCESLPRPWLGLCVAFPYLIMVVAMGYTRQSVALGSLLIGYVILTKGNKLKFFLLNIFASLFHLSSIIGVFLLVPYYISSPKYVNKISKIIISFLFGIVLYFVFIDKYIASYIFIYIESQMSSSGVFIRLFMVVFPSILFLLLGKNLQINKNQIILWKSISFYSLSLIFLLIISPSSTIIDRLTLYALPIMIFVFSNLPELKFAKLSRKYINLSVVLMAFLIQYVWLNFADNSGAWNPYQNILF